MAGLPVRLPGRQTGRTCLRVDTHRQTQTGVWLTGSAGLQRYCLALCQQAKDKYGVPGTGPEVPRVPPENERLKRLSRRRRQLASEKVRVVNRMQADLQAVCPELLAIPSDADNLWFLRFLSSRDDLRKLARMHKKSVLAIPGIGKKYAGIIQEWQKRAKFSPEVEYVGPMIVSSDARHILELLREIAALDEAPDPTHLELGRLFPPLVLISHEKLNIVHAHLA